MAEQPVVVVEVARGSAVDRQLRERPLPVATSDEVTIVSLAVESGGRLEPPDAGQVVMSLPSPEALVRERDEPLVVVVEAAEELRDDELAAMLEAARRSRRAVILRIAGDA